MALPGTHKYNSHCNERRLAFESLESAAESSPGALVLPEPGKAPAPNGSHCCLLSLRPLLPGKIRFMCVYNVTVGPHAVGSASMG